MSPTHRADPATSLATLAETEVGSVFVSNYPPYSLWSEGNLPDVERALDAPGRPDAPLGLYLHIPFCRKRCKFCYFKVYTDKNGDEVKRYLDALAREVGLLAARPAVAGRALSFVYFGGGTPSFIGSRQLVGLVASLKAELSWDAVREITFECEPGTLTRPKLEAIRKIGVTRLSLGVENYDDRILAENGRAHTTKEIRRVWPWIREIGFELVNIDLIAGMVGESWESWRTTIDRTIEAAPDSVTIYQMELPFNTVYSKQVLDGSVKSPVADWATKRAWHEHAFARLEAAGYEVASSYTAVRRGTRQSFLYRDALWHGADLLGTGVASFSHLSGVHFQNLSGWGPYLERIEAGRLATERALAPSSAELMTREMILQLKLGQIDAGYFREKFGVEILRQFAPAWERLAGRAMLGIEGDRVTLTRDGLLRVDSLLPEFYDERYRGARYT